MKKEQLKTIILTLLIFSSVILSIQIWFSNPVWSERYSLSALLNTFKKPKSDLNINDTGAFNSVFSPRSYVFTYNDGRLFFSTTETEAKAVRSAFNNAIKSAFSAQNTAVISESDWQSVLKSSSISADYSVPVSTSALADFLGTGGADGITLSSFDQAAITFDQIVTNAYICFRSSKENTQVRIPLSDSREVKQIYEQFSGRTKESYAYAFEMNLDKPVNSTAVQQKVVFGSYVLIPLETITMNTIHGESIAVADDAAAESIIELFGYNPKTARKFSESNGTVLYIDNKATIKLNSQSGRIEYTATDGGGVLLSDSGKLSAVATGCGKLIDSIFNLFSIDPNVTLFINSPLDNDNANEYTITFDYLFNGNNIQGENHGCKIVISNGKIKSFTANIKNYTLISETGTENAQNVLDNLYTSLNRNALSVTKLYTGYIDSNQAMPLCWRAEVEGTDEIITVK